MKSNHNYSLVKEAYELEEAKELLMSLLDGTIRFHSINSLRSWERKGVKDTDSEKRLAELNEVRESMIDLFNNLDGENISVEIDTEIKLTVKKA